MLKKLLDLFEQAGEDTMPVKPELAAAVLMVEVMAADHQWDDVERETIDRLLREELGLSASETTELLEEASDTQQATHDLFAFTKEINDHYEESDKYRLLVNLWQVAYADGNVDRYEDYMIRKIADLLYLPHGRFMQAKHEAKPD